jgi:hypothetical protein
MRKYLDRELQESPGIRPQVSPPAGHRHRLDEQSLQTSEDLNKTPGRRGATPAEPGTFGCLDARSTAARAVSS